MQEFPNMDTCVILISGRGSNMCSLLDSAGIYRCLGVFADCEAPGLRAAQDYGVTTKVFAPSGKEKKQKIESQLSMADEIEGLGAHWVVLAGFMQILSSEFLKRFPSRVLNIHPSLLPDFPGLNTHRRVLQFLKENNMQSCRHGCTVHLVDEGIDTGHILAQAAIQISSLEIEQQISARVLEQEHRLYPWVLGGLASGEIQTSPLGISHSWKQQALERKFSVFQG